jgi:hypothetical protein
MACYAITTEGEEALTTSTETVLQLRGAAASRGKLVAWGISFDGVDSTAAPIQIDLLRQTTDGTATAATEGAFDAADPATPAVTGHHSFIAEPTPGVVLESMHVHPQGGLIIREYPPGREIFIEAATTSRLGIRVVTPGAAVNCVAFMHWEE